MSRILIAAAAAGLLLAFVPSSAVQAEELSERIEDKKKEYDDAKERHEGGEKKEKKNKGEKGTEKKEKNSQEKKEKKD